VDVANLENLLLLKIIRITVVCQNLVFLDVDSKIQINQSYEQGLGPMGSDQRLLEESIEPEVYISTGTIRNHQSYGCHYYAALAII